MDYKKLVSSLTRKEDTFTNFILAFISGGIIGAISEILVSMFNVETMTIIWIFTSSLLTGLSYFDNLVDIFRMGLIIPTTGFANSVTSAMLEHKKEGLITGVGSNSFKLAGSVILYGILVSALLAFVRCLICIL